MPRQALVSPALERAARLYSGCTAAVLHCTRTPVCCAREARWLTVLCRHSRRLTRASPLAYAVCCGHAHMLERLLEGAPPVAKLPEAGPFLKAAQLARRV